MFDHCPKLTRKYNVDDFYSFIRNKCRIKYEKEEKQTKLQLNDHKDSFTKPLLQNDWVEMHWMIDISRYFVKQTSVKLDL